MHRVRLGLFLAAFAAWTATVVLTLLTPECDDAFSGDCATNWASDAAKVTVVVAVAFTAIATIVGIAHWVTGLVRGRRR